MKTYEYLSDSDVAQFLSKGYVTIKNAFTEDQARVYTEALWVRLGYDPNDKSTWANARTHMPNLNSIDVKAFAPRAYGAICELVGGEERMKTPLHWGDGFIANLGKPEHAQTWEPPSAQSGGWHKDGDWFVHFLDSPEQALLVIVLWSDVHPTGGATFIATDSVPVIARFVADHPEGVEPGQFDFTSLIGQCREFEEATGKVGDVILMHPYMLHATSKNKLRAVRLITNPSVQLREPMQFNREDPEEFSLVEQAVLRGLGVERFDYQPTGERRRVIPERIRIQAEMKAAEEARLAAAGK